MLYQQAETQTSCKGYAQIFGIDFFDTFALVAI